MLYMCGAGVTDAWMAALRLKAQHCVAQHGVAHPMKQSSQRTALQPTGTDVRCGLVRWCVAAPSAASSGPAVSSSALKCPAVSSSVLKCPAVSSSFLKCPAVSSSQVPLWDSRTQPYVDRHARISVAVAGHIRDAPPKQKA
eukprot:355843-Chlamydomonas_euryale.AAC.2